MAGTISINEALAAAWTYCAPARAKDIPYPRGFWPDVARVAVAIYEQQSLTPTLDFHPTRSGHGFNEPESTGENATKRRGKNSRGTSTTSASERAANTARLLAMLAAKEEPTK